MLHPYQWCEMSPESPWLDPRTWIALVSTIFGACGFLFGVLSNYWNRRETRLDALSKTLEPMVRCAQHLNAANDCRRRCEQLRRSYPDEDLAKEATERANRLLGEFNDHLTQAHEQFLLAEAGLAVRVFRFPDRVGQMVNSIIKSLKEYNRLVNAGMFDNADAHVKAFGEEYGRVRRYARGLRLSDPLEGCRRRFKKPKVKHVPDPYELEPSQREAIAELLFRRATTQAQNTFAVHPPRKLIETPELANSERVIEELGDSVFVVVLQDGTSKMLSLPELVFFVYSHIVLQELVEDASRMARASSTQEVDITVNISIPSDQLMQPEFVKVILSKIEFSSVPSD